MEYGIMAFDMIVAVKLVSDNVLKKRADYNYNNNYINNNNNNNSNNNYGKLLPDSPTIRAKSPSTQST